MRSTRPIRCIVRRAGQAEHILLDLDSTVARAAIEDHSGGEGFYAFVVIERAVEVVEPAADQRLPITVKIEALHLSARTENVLKRHGITTVDQLAEINTDALLSLKGLRRKDRQDLVRALAELGFLRGED